MYPYRVGLLVSILLVATAAGWGQVPQVVYANPIAGFSLEVPQDWEMGSGVFGSVLIGLDGEMSTGVPYQLPLLWFFYSKQAPEATAKTLADALRELTGATMQPRATGQNGEWEIAFTAATGRGNFQQRWLCRTQDGHHYVIGAIVPQEIAAACQGEVDRALATCKLIPRPPLRLFREPRENAYTMVLPKDWTWEGEVYRAENVPGYFTWKVQSPDRLTGAFSAPPGVMNVTVPYTPAGELARTLVLAELQKQIPGLRFDKLQEYPRTGAYYRGIIKTLGLGENPRVDKVRADYLADVGGTEIRLRVGIATVMLDASPLLGGRGNWFLTAAGAWAPSAKFEEQYPLGRGAIASLYTDPVWKNNQFEAVGEVTLWRKWISRLYQFLFNVEYLEAEDTLHLPPIPPPPPDEE